MITDVSFSSAAAFNACSKCTCCFFVISVYTANVGFFLQWKKKPHRDSCDTDKSRFFYKPHSIWLICPVVLIPELGWLNLSISFSYQCSNRSTAGHWTKTPCIVVTQKSQRVRTGRGEVYQNSSLQGIVTKKKKSPLCYFKDISHAWDKHPSCYCHDTHIHTLLLAILQ